MNKVKNDKGITIIALIITIVITLILATVTINVGMEEIETTKYVKFISYMQAIQKKVDIIVEYNEDYTQYGEALTNEKKTTLESILDESITAEDSLKYRFFDKAKLKTDFELEDVDDEIVINFETRKVISLRGIKYNGTMYYTQYDLPAGQKLVEYSGPTRDLSFQVTKIMNGLNGKFRISGISIKNASLSYGKEVEAGEVDWKLITNMTNPGETFETETITKPGVYYFKLVDNVTGRDNSEDNVYPSYELRLVNAPKIQIGLDKTTLSSTYDYAGVLTEENPSENWATITGVDEEEYVWIPRFAYATDENDVVTNIEFLTDNTNITTSRAVRKF